MLRRIPGRQVLLRIVQPTDRQPHLADDAELVDAESGHRLAIAPGSEALRRYTAAYDAYFNALDAYVTRRGASHRLIDSAELVQQQLERLFPRGLLQI